MAGLEKELPTKEERPMIIAVAYKRATRESQRWALELGRQDAEEASAIHAPSPELSFSAAAHNTSLIVSPMHRKLSIALRKNLPKQLRKLSSFSPTSSPSAKNG